MIPLALVSYRFADLKREAMTSQVLQTHALSANTGADRISSTVSAWETLIDAVVASPQVENDPSSAAAKKTVQSLLQSRGDRGRGRERQRPQGLAVKTAATYI